VTLDQTAANRWPVFTDEDEAAVLAVLRDGDLSTHPVVRHLEDDYRRYFGVRHALAHCNGTAALMAAFFAANLQPGDEVIVPSATWWASAVPMLWLGALPVFAESEERRGGLDPEDVERKLTPRTRAIVVVHLWGMPARMTRLLEIARAHNLTVIEDASHAHGATWRDRKCGTLGDMAIFSLQGHKLAPAGEGGMFLTDRDDLYERAALLGDVLRIAELPSPARRFWATTYGIKTRMAPLNAAVARVSLRRLDERNARRNANLEYLSSRLEALGFETFRPPPHVQRVYFEFLVRPPADLALRVAEMIRALQAEGCDAQQPRYPLLHQQPLFTEGEYLRVARLPDGPTYRPDALPRTEALNEQLIRLPAFPQAERALLEQYASAFEKVLANAEAVAHHLRASRKNTA